MGRPLLTPEPPMNQLDVVRTMARCGLLVPSLRAPAQLRELGRWGFGLAGELRQAAARAPRRAAVVDEMRGEITYAGLLARAELVAAALRARGLLPGQRVGLLARNHLGLVENLVGAALVGLDVVLLNTGLGRETTAQVSAEQQLLLIVHDDDLADLVAGVPPAVATVAESEWVSELARTEPTERVAPPERRSRTIILTSGTTGVPKGAARRSPRGVGPLVSIVDRIPLRVGDRILVSAPLFHTWGYAAFQLAVGLRATVVLRRHFDAETARATLESQRCDAMFAVPVMLQRMMELPCEPTARQRRPLRVVATSGSAYPAGLATRFMNEYGDVLYNLYGSTEASWVCIATPADLRRDPATVGTPPIGTTVRIVDDEGRDVPPGHTGRILCGNSLVFDGYTSGHAEKVVDGLVATGDMGHTRDGLYFVDGRDDDMVVSGGENVYPGEVESLLGHHPAVREVAVVGVPDETFGQRLLAVIALRDGAHLSADEVRAHVREHRARHCVPRDVIFVDELPRNHTGKVCTRELGGLSER